MSDYFSQVKARLSDKIECRSSQMKRLAKSTWLAMMIFSQATYAQMSMIPKNKNALGISKSNLFSAGQSICEAADRTPVASSQLYTLSTSTDTISKLLACARAREFKSFRFSRASCSDVSICEEVLVDTVSVSDTYKVLNEVMAFDYAKNVLAVQSDSMEKMEIMKAFAREKYKDEKLGNACWPKFKGNPKKSAVCNNHMLEAAYKELQTNCTSGIGCHNKDEGDVMSYNSFVEKEKIPKTAFVFDYNNYRISAKVKNQLNKDSEYVDKLAKLAESSDFSKLTADQKAEKVLEAIGLEAGSKLRDPVLDYDFSIGSPDKNILKKSQKFQDLMKIFSKKNLTEKSFKSDFEQYRKKRVDMIFGEGKCNDEPRVSKICHDMTNLSEGKTIKKDAQIVENHTSRNGMNSSDFLRLKKILGDKLTEEDAEILLNSRRCAGFELYGSRIIPNNNGENVTAAQPEVIPPSDDYRPKGIDTGVNLFGQKVGSSSNDYLSKKDDYAEEPTSSEDPKNFKDYKTESQTAQGVNPITGEAIGQSGYASNPINDSLNNSYYNTLAHKDEEADKKENANNSNEDSYINSNSSSAIEDKISDLEKRLAAATEKMAEMKLENETAEAQRVSEKKIADENAKIKELQSQLETMKTVQRMQNETSSALNRAKSRDDSDSSQSRSSYNNSSSSGASVISGNSSTPRQESVSSKVSGTDIRESSSSNDSGVSSAISNNAASKSTISSVSLTGVNNSSNDSRTITAVDGMSAEKAFETITSRILELKGIPFFIEEGGMVKEIIPVLKDGVVQLDEKGNPLYEKIVKGKANDKKFAKLKDKGRAPASITSNADLKIDQEEKLKRERAEYNKLKALTNGVLKKDK